MLNPSLRFEDKLREASVAPRYGCFASCNDLNLSVVSGYNFVYTTYIQRPLAARFRRVNLFFKYLIFLRISRSVPSITFRIGIAMCISQYTSTTQGRSGPKGNRGDLRSTR